MSKDCFGSDVWREIFDKCMLTCSKIESRNLYLLNALARFRTSKLNVLFRCWYPLRQDQLRYKRFVKILFSYRMTMVQIG